MFIINDSNHIQFIVNIEEKINIMQMGNQNGQSNTIKKILCFSSMMIVMAVITVALFLATTKKLASALQTQTIVDANAPKKMDATLRLSAKAAAPDSPETLFANIPEEGPEIKAEMNISPASNAPTNAASTSIDMTVTGSWPSADYSMFNFKNDQSWESDPSIGKGEKYPGLDKTCDSSKVSTQGIAGPTTAFRFSMPVETPRISSFFGWRKIYGRIHYGTDFAGKKGTPILASERGTVTNATTGKNSGTFGIFVELNHGDSFTTLYAHMSKVAVKAGDHIEKGDVIGYMGSTGATDANHLHFEIRHKGIPYNPFLCYMNLPTVYASGEAEPEDIFLSIPDEQ